MARKTKQEKMLEAINALPAKSKERQDAVSALFNRSRPKPQIGAGLKTQSLLEQMQDAPLGSPQRQALAKAMIENLGKNEPVPSLDSRFVDHLDAQ